MDSISKGSNWKNSETGEKIKVLDCGIWVLHVDSKVKKTYSFEEFVKLFSPDVP